MAPEAGTDVKGSMRCNHMKMDDVLTTVQMQIYRIWEIKIARRTPAQLRQDCVIA